MESLVRLREPATVVVLGALCAELVVTVISLAVYGGPDVYDSVTEAALLLGGGLPQTLTILILTLLVASCLLGRRTRHAGVLAVLAIIAGSTSVLLAVVFSLIGLAGESPTRYVDFVASVLSLIVPSVAVVGLGILARRQRAAQLTAAATPTPAVSQQQIAATPAPVQEQQPTWQPDAATGIAWPTAGEAAAGAPGSGWSNPSEAGGWQAPFDAGDPWRPSGGYPAPEADPGSTQH
jgi:Na+/proline symporter